MVIQNWRPVLATAVFVLVALFAFQNMARVELSFLFWTFESRRIVVISISLLFGFILGWIIGYRRTEIERTREDSDTPSKRETG